MSVMRQARFPCTMSARVVERWALLWSPLDGELCQTSFTLGSSAWWGMLEAQLVGPKSIFTAAATTVSLCSWRMASPSLTSGTSRRSRAPTLSVRTRRPSQTTTYHHWMRIRFDLTNCFTNFEKCARGAFAQALTADVSQMIDQLTDRERDALMDDFQVMF